MESKISIHAPTWGATLASASNIGSHFDFNPRTHLGCDHQAKSQRLWSPYFNPRTHLGCDKITDTAGKAGKDFNPRTHLGCDYVKKVFIKQRNKFQSTHPLGVRQTVRRSVGTTIAISIHAPTWGATVYGKDNVTGTAISIHAPTWGATTLLSHVLPSLFYFNPRTHLGCDYQK